MKALINKYKKDLLILSAGNFLKILLTILLTRLATYFLDYEDYANYILIISIYNFFSLLLISPIGPYIIVNSTEFLNKNTLYSFYKNLFIKYIIPVSILAGLSMVFYFLIFESYVIIYVSAGIIFLLIFKSLFEITNQYFNLFKRNLLFFIYIISFLLMNIFSGIIFIEFFGNNYLSWFYSFVVSNIILSILVFIKFKKLYKNKNNKPYSFNKKALNFSLYILSANIFSWALYDGSKLIGENIFQKNDLGVLLLGFAISAQIFSTLENFLNQLILPWLYDKILIFSPISKYNKFKKYYKTVFPILLLAFFGSVLFSDLIIYILVDESKINEGLKIFFIVGLSIEMLKSLINTLKNVFYIELKGWVVSFSNLIGVITFIGLVFCDSEINTYNFSLYILYAYIISLIVYISFTIFYQFRWLKHS